jgi:hypothetical protein
LTPAKERGLLVDRHARGTLRLTLGVTMTGRLVFGFVAIFAFAACSDTNKDNYTYALEGTAVMLTAVGIHRAITDDCWAHCSPGYLCNEESGLCEKGECVPACELGQHCVHERGGHFRCIPDADPSVSAATAATPPATRVPR